MGFAVLLGAVAGCENAPPPRPDDGGSTLPDAGQRDAGPLDERDAGESDAGESDAGDGPGPDAGPAPEAAWGRRACSVTVRFTPSSSAASVRLAGDFTGWGEAALPMLDPDGDGVHAVTVGPENGLVPGRLHAYRVIVDGTYLLDPSAQERKYDGDCINSGLRAPSCDAGPEIVPGTLSTTFEGPTGSARVRATILTALDGAAPRDVRVALDGAPLGAGVTLDRDAGAYDVALSGLPAGLLFLAFRATDVRGREASPIDLPFWIEATPFEWRDALMYMIVVDRFANADRASDAPVGVEYPADFHGGDLDGVLAVMRTGYFEQLGVNVLWLSPLNTQAEGSFGGRDDAHAYAGYHGYWPRRGRSVEPRFGGDDALRALIDEAHARGIRVLLDLINNQVHTQHEYFTAHPEWFRSGCVCGVDPGCGWSERPLDCLFAPYLPDINWRVPAAEDQFVSDALHWIEAYGVDGFRIDAVKHVETNSIFNLRAATARRYEQGGYRHYFVGETAVGQWDSVDYGCGERYADGYAWLDAYTGPSALDGQFDFPTNHRLAGLVDGTLGFDGVEAVVQDAQRRLRPEGLHVRFLGTHDSGRMATRAARDPSGGCRWADGPCASLPRAPTSSEVFARLRRALAVLDTMPGIPFLYYGDEIAMPGGNDPDNRRDMIWDAALDPVAMSRETLSAEQRAFRQFVGDLGRARAQSDAVRRGRRVPLVVEPDLYVVAWTGERPGSLAVMVANRGPAISGRPIDGLSAGSLEGVVSFDAAAGPGTLRRASTGTRLTLDLPAGEAALFIAR